MRVKSLKYDLLVWLYEKYQQKPGLLTDVAPLMNEHGVYALTSIMEFGNALKNSGYLKKFEGTEYTYLAEISLQGINLISGDLTAEVVQLLNGIKDDDANYYPVLNHLEYLPNQLSVANDVCRFMLENGYVDCRSVEGEMFIRITERGQKFVESPEDPSGKLLRIA